MKIIKIAQLNVALPPDKIPNSNTEYVHTERLIDVSLNHNKEYIIVVYKYSDDTYSTVAWYGRIGGTLQMAPKYYGGNLDRALGVAGDLNYAKIRKGYTSYDDSRVSIIGRPANGSRAQAQPPTQQIQRPPQPLAFSNISNDIKKFIEEMVNSQTGVFKDRLYFVRRMRGPSSGEYVWRAEEALLRDRNNLLRSSLFEDYQQAIKKTAEWASELETKSKENSQPIIKKQEEPQPPQEYVDFVDMDLLSKKNNINLKKYAQSEESEDFYTTEVARTTTNPKILVEMLKREKDNYVSQLAARNPNCPPEILAEVLRRGNNDYVSCDAAQNPNCPSEALAEVLRRGNDDKVSRSAAKNPNCPPEALAEILRRENDYIVSQYAAKNPNCPPQAKLKWMKDTGKITKYDPSKHILDYEDKKEENKFKELEDLISDNSDSRFNLKKYAQSEENYKAYVAKTTTNPEILKEILRRGNDDNVSWFAADNPNCPPETLAEVLRRGKNNYVSQVAALNPNCPPEALAEVLKRGNDDWVSRCAAENIKKQEELVKEKTRHPQKYVDFVDMDLLSKKNDINLKRYSQNTQNKDIYTAYVAKTTTNPEALVEILRRGNDDWVSRNAADNPNCPSEALAEVLKRGKNDGVSWYSALNPNCPPEILAEVLRRGNSNYVSINAASNPNCPPEALAEILRRENDYIVSQYAAQNPNCPPEALAEVLKRGKDDNISQVAARNPNCPPQAKLKWMKDTGKLTKYDPKKHKIDKPKEENKFKELEDLIINKQAQNQSWYSLEKTAEKDLKGYFTFIIRSNDLAEVYNVWWEGFGDNVNIKKHNIPTKEFNENKSEIIKRAKEESLIAYREKYGK